MSQEDVARLQTAVEAFNRRDGARFDRLLASDAVIVPVRAALEGTTFHGHDAGSQYVAAVEEIRESNASVVALGHIRGRGRGTGATIDTSGGWVAHFRDGLMTRFQTCTSRKEALAAADLPDSH